MNKLNKFLIVVCLVILANSTKQFLYSAKYSFYTGGYSASVVKISPTTDYMVVGYTNGSARIYSMEGYTTIYLAGHSYKIIDAEWVPGYGPITLDSSGMAIRWGASGSIMYTWMLNSSVIDMSLSSGSSYYIAFNFGTVIK